MKGIAIAALLLVALFLYLSLGEEETSRTHEPFKNGGHGPHRHHITHRLSDDDAYRMEEMDRRGKEEGGGGEGEHRHHHDPHGDDDDLRGLGSYKFEVALPSFDISL